MSDATFTIPERPWSLNAERRGTGGHGHWSVTREHTAHWREWFAWQGLQQRARFTTVHVTVDVVMRHPVQDTGACYGAVKAAIDGLVDSRVLPGDGPAHVLSITMNAPRKPEPGERESLTLRLTKGNP